MFSAWWTKRRNLFFLFLMTLLSLFFSFLFLFFYFHREKIPLHVFSPKYTKLRDWHHEVSARALNVQWFMSLAPPSSQHIPFHSLFLFSNLITKSVLNLPYEKNRIFSILFWSFPVVKKRKTNLFCASW